MNEPSDPSLSHAPVPEPDSLPKVRRGRPLGPIAPLLVILLALAAVGTSYYLFTRGSSGRSSGAGSAPAPHKTGVAVLPFPPETGADEVAWVGEAAFRFLPFALEDSTDLRVLTPERLHDLSGGDHPGGAAADPLEPVRKAGIDFILRGTVSGKPGAATLKASWLEAGSGKELEAWQVDGIRPDNLGRKLDEIHARLRQLLRLQPLGATDAALAFLVPIKEAPTRSYLDASALLDKGDPAGCLKSLAEALTLSDFHMAQFLQAEAAARAGDPRTAVTSATRLSRVSRPLPARVTLMVPAILAVYSSGNPRSAVAPLESFLARFPDEKYPLSWLGAIEILLLNEPDRARENLARSLALDPSNQEAQRLLGQATLAGGHAAQAVPILEAALKARSDDDRTRLLLSDALRQSGRMEESRRAAEEVLSRQPENPRAVATLGSILLEEGKAREAEELYRRLAGSPQPGVKAQGEVLLGQLSILQGRFNEGLRLYRAAVDDNGRAGDRSAQATQLLALAELQSALGKHPDALTTLGEVRGIDSRVDPDFPMINIIVAQKQFDTARKLLEEQAGRWQGRVSGAVLERLRNSLEGTIALEQGKYSEAVKRIEDSLPESEKKNPYSEALGRACLGAGDAARAEKIFRQITQDPNRFQDPVRYLSSLIRLGEACEKLGKGEEARQLYRDALKWWGSADFTLPVIAEAREGLKRLGG